MCRMFQLRILWNIEAKSNKAVARKKGNMKYDKVLPLAKIWKCARKLRNDIFALQSKQICEPVTIDNIMECDAIHPDSVKSFFKML